MNGRSQRVIFKNAVSKIIYVASGMPQGSHLGPNVLMYDDDDVSFGYHIIILSLVSACSQILIDSRNGVSTTFST